MCGLYKLSANRKGLICVHNLLFGSDLFFFCLNFKTRMKPVEGQTNRRLVLPSRGSSLQCALVKN
jgi:hypothetical protein